MYLEIGVKSWLLLLLRRHRGVAGVPSAPARALPLPLRGQGASAGRRAGLGPALEPDAVSGLVALEVGLLPEGLVAQGALE